MGKMSNGNYVKWEKCQMGNVKWECQMGMSNGKNVKWDAFCIFKLKKILIIISIFLLNKFFLRIIPPSQNGPFFFPQGGIISRNKVFLFA